MANNSTLQHGSVDVELGWCMLIKNPGLLIRQTHRGGRRGWGGGTMMAMNAVQWHRPSRHYSILDMLDPWSYYHHLLILISNTIACVRMNLERTAHIFGKAAAGAKFTHTWANIITSSDEAYSGLIILPIIWTLQELGLDSASGVGSINECWFHSFPYMFHANEHGICHFLRNRINGYFGVTLQCTVSIFSTLPLKDLRHQGRITFFAFHLYGWILCL